LMEKVHWSVMLARPPRVRAGGVLTKLSCAPHSGGCRVTVALLVRRSNGGAPGRGKRRQLVVGERTFSLRAGTTRVVAVALRSAGRTRLATATPLIATEAIALTVAGQRTTAIAVQVTIPR
jgi:hypothetical protein